MVCCAPRPVQRNQSAETRQGLLASWPLFSSGKFPVLQVSSLAWVTGPKLKDRKFWVIYRTGPDGVWATNDYVAAGWLCLLYYHVVMLCFISYCISYPHILWCYHPWQHPCEAEDTSQGLHSKAAPFWQALRRALFDSKPSTKTSTVRSGKDANMRVSMTGWLGMTWKQDKDA